MSALEPRVRSERRAVKTPMALTATGTIRRLRMDRPFTWTSEAEAWTADLGASPGAEAVWEAPW
jgi:hypothetical protein